MAPPQRLCFSALCLFFLLAGCEGAIEVDDGPAPIDAGAGADGDIPDPPDGGGPIDAGPACVGEGAVTSALALDGTDDYVGMGVAPSLGLAQFTLEAWVRRDGRGTAAGTGVGGVAINPVVAKGRGESDGSNLDCNYAFGFSGAVLAADFEDMASGANHPIVGVTPVPYGEWHHIAATYDGSTWRLYLDGRLDAERTVDATPRADSIQHFGIGTMFNSMGVPAGRLHGAVDEVRVWSRALGEAEIAAGLYKTLDSGDGLVSRWALDEADGAAPDSLGGNDGTLAGASFVSPGAILDYGEAPAVTASSPDDRTEVAGTSIELAVDVADLDSDAFSVTFYGRELTDEDDFTIAVMPDTQYYTVQGTGREHYFREQTRWIMDNREAYDIVAVIHNGDIVQRGDRTYEWRVADSAMSTLETPLDLLPDGLPYGVTPGNHDQQPIGTTNSTANFNTFFGVDRFSGRAYYGGHYGRDNDENWITFQAGGLDFVLVNLQFDTTQDPAVLAWARRIFEAHPHAFGILNSHYIVNRDGTFGPQGQAIYNGLRDVDNLQLMTCGHVSAEAARTDTHEGNVIHSMLADYQGRENGGNGWMRIWEFSPANDELTIRTYSPSLDRWETDANSEFTLPVDLSGAGGPFTEIGVIDRATGGATIRWDVEPGRVYEWYAVATDCYHSVKTEVRRFTTAP